MNALVLGDSFIKRFHRHCSLKRPIYFNLSKHGKFNKNKLKLPDKIGTLFTLGYSGATLETFEVPRIINKLNPSLIIMNIGSNDLDNHIPPLNVADNLIELAKYLSNKFTAKIVLCSILYRSKLRYTHPMDYKEKVDLCNRIVSDHCEVENNLEYYKLRGYWNRPVNEWSVDGVHPSPAQFAKHIRRALINGVREK